MSFFLRYYVGNRSKFGHEFMEFEITRGIESYFNVIIIELLITLYC